MKKTLLTFALIILSGCSLGNIQKNKEKSLPNKSVQSQINILQQRIDLGEITEKEAQEELKNTLRENQKLNDGSTKSILKKFEMIDPKTAQALEEKIRQNHPEALTE